MLLIDDGPHERAWVRQEIPELRVPELPSDPTMYASWVGSLPSAGAIEMPTLAPITT